MSLALWIVLGVAITVTLGYVLCMRVLARNSCEIDKQVDFKKLRPSKDDASDD